MDLHSFIQSGLLEAYALGQCTAEERALVERMVAGHAEARAELAAIEQALEGYASANAAAPPAWMKGRILEAVGKEPAASPLPPDRPAAGVPGNRTGWLLPALALALALLAAFFFYQYRNSETEKTDLQARVAELQIQVDDCNRRAAETDRMRQAVVLLRDRDTKVVELSNGEGGKATAYAYHNTVRCEIGLDVSSLPAPAPGKHLQFWAIVDGKPVSMGMVQLQAAGGWQTLPCLTGAAALAVSQEDNPNGNATPTQVVLVGNIPAG